jgi:hypothetical protein
MRTARRTDSQEWLLQASVRHAATVRINERI